MNRKHRVARLEARAQGVAAEAEDAKDALRRQGAAELYLKMLDNVGREEDGLPPEPYTEEELALQRELDEEFLRDDLPRMRADPGWQSEEARQILDAWEEQTRKEVEER